MVVVPEGRFFTGCNATLGSQCAGDESPQHAVDLPTLSIDVFEVTANSYRQCVSTGDCPEPRERSSRSDLARIRLIES